MTVETTDDRRAPIAAIIAAGLLAAGVVVQVLALASDRFQSSLNSDFLIAHFFAQALTDPTYPISAWKFGSGTFWFPDYLAYLPLRGIFGDSGLSYPAYAVAWYLTLTAVTGWTLAAAGASRWLAAAAAGLAVNLLLLCQWIPGHAIRLWELGIPAFHGGNILSGLALVALGLGAWRAGGWSRPRATVTTGVMTLALISNALVLMHWIAPLAIALAWQARVAPERRAVLRTFLWLAGLALALAIVVRAGFALAQEFFFASLFREWPLPWLVWRALKAFFADLFFHGLLVNLWMFWLLASVAIPSAIVSLERARRSRLNAATQIALVAGLLGLAAGWATPIGATYWKDPAHFRYLFNWLVVPMWMLTLLALARVEARRWIGWIGAGVAVLAMGFAAPRIAPAKLRFPHPAGADALRDYCQRHHLTQGLGDFWAGYPLTVAWGFHGPRLGNIDNDDFARFWCNDALAYFPPRPGGGLDLPHVQFIVLDGLDPARMAKWLGSPLSIERVGPYALARLTPEQSRRAGELITQQALAFLKGRRAEWLRRELAADPARRGEAP